ncbi:inositol monophosphatase family protein [Pseudohongiella nitratireducens]|uniref:inositol monophosphatase family protein n=1 Tax=Pseudohongiella nitratireducens TaxID=1768907 RepID=UPI0030EB277D|tara:strand:- start:18104 stop:18931 length:828 start_codon:yes stop_codon:yes gene_type:complete
MQSDAAAIQEFSQRIAKEAGHLMVERLKAGAESLATRYKASGSELVTQVDEDVDALISLAIQEAFAGHLILAEESAPDTQGLSQIQEPLWILDPIDGTVNYAHDHSHSAVSIAWACQGKVLSAVVYNPFTDEMFTAVKGQGAYLNGRAIEPSGVSEMKRALFATGFPYQKDNLAPLMERMSVMLSNCADLRRAGSAALDICWVAMGRLDIYYENLSVWDFAAAQLIAREAGAVYGHFKEIPPGVNPEFHDRHILVANSQAMFDRAHAMLSACPAG